MEIYNQEGVGREYTLRPATVDDIDKAMGIHHRSYRELIKKQFGNFNEAEQDRYFMDAWSGKHELFIVGGEIVGYVCVEKEVDHYLLSTIVIDPDFQGKGIGSSFIKDLIKKAEEEKLPVRLQVLKENEAKILYENLGFTVIEDLGTRLVMEHPVT